MKSASVTVVPPEPTEKSSARETSRTPTSGLPSEVRLSKLQPGLPPALPVVDSMSTAAPPTALIVLPEVGWVTVPALWA